MKIDDKHYRTIWLSEDGWSVSIIDQTKLPHRFEIICLKTVEEAAHAIKSMQVRGAPLIGATAAYGLCLALRENPDDATLDRATEYLAGQRPTAINLRWALDEIEKAVRNQPYESRLEKAYAAAKNIADEDVETCRMIGVHGLEIFKKHAAQKKGPLNILTHCNAGWLATVDWGTATSPIYQAFDQGIDLHVWVDETRPRCQGAALTAFELGGHRVPHTIITDNAGGHLMQRGEVDLCIVGTDRTASNGDVANKIGTYLKALAADDNNIPFYVALPHSTIDWQLEHGFDIPIEERAAEEILEVRGEDHAGLLHTVRIAAHGSPAINHAFDVTPARLVTGLITERGVTEASAVGLKRLYPEKNVQNSGSGD